MHVFPISVRPYVSKFIMSRYQEPVWVINKQERIGKMLYNLLDRAPDRYDKEKDLGASIRIGLCSDYVRNKGVYLSNASIEEFNEFIKLEIIEEIAKYRFQVKNRIGLKKYKELYIRHSRARGAKVHVIQDPDVSQYFEQREIIYDILKLYGITEDDMAFDTVSKACQRLKLPLLTHRLSA